MTTAGKLWLGFGALILILALSAIAIIVRVWSVEGRVNEMSEARDRLAAASQLEINVLGYALAVSAYLQTGEPAVREDAAGEAAKAEQHFNKYQSRAVTSEQQEMAERFIPMWQELRDLGQAMLDSENRQAKPEDAKKLYDLRIRLERLLDEEMQAEAVSTYESHSRDALQDVQRIVLFVALLLIVAAVIALVTSLLVGKAVIGGERFIEDARNYAESVVETVREPLIVLTADLRVKTANRSFYQTFRVATEETRDRLIYELGDGQWDIPALRKLLEDVLPQNTKFHDYEVEHDFPGIGPKHMLLNARRLYREGNHTELILLAIEDVTERKQTEGLLRESSERVQMALDSAELGSWRVDPETMTLATDERFRAIFGVTASQIDYEHAFAIIHPDDQAKVQAAVEAATRPDDPEHYAVEYRVVHPDGSARWISAKGRANFGNEGSERKLLSFDGTVADITERKQANSLLTSHRHALEMLAKGEQLEQVLDFLARSMESQSRDSLLVAIHLMEEDGHHFGHVTAPSLPSSYAQATRGMDARLQLDSCSTAVMSGKPTVVRDFAAETRWPAFAAEAVSLGLRACFTTPIFASDQRIMGTFAVYYREPLDPSPHDQKLVEIFTRTASISIERRQAEAAMEISEVRYRRLFESSQDGILILDAGTAKITDANPFIGELLGYPHTELIGKELWEIGLFKDIKESKAAMRELQDKQFIRYEDLPLETKAGRRADVEFVSNMYTEDHHSVIQCNIRDITERKVLQDSKEQSTNELRKLAADLSEADRRKNEFLAMLAHELRNPLAPIRNALQIMRLTGEGGMQMRTASDMMERQVGQLVRLVDDLLDVSRITRGKIELRLDRVELASIIYQAVEAVRPSCEKGGVELSVSLGSEPIYLNGDSARLNQVVGNLLNNACKFTDEGGRINLIVESESNQAVIRIKDTGIGIAPDQIISVFDMFVQADTSLERAVSGLGIGLTLVKNLVEMHGGSVEAHSPGLGRGSEFIVRLPVMNVPNISSSAPDIADGNGANVISRKILVVDDNVDSAESLAMLLQITGHEVRMAHDGRAAVDTAGEFLPEIILLDIGLPRLNGYEAAREIRQQEWGKGMVLIALTGWGQEEDRQRSKDAGFDSHIVKPVDHIELMKQLDDLTVPIREAE